MPNRRESVTIEITSFIYQHRGSIHSVTDSLYNQNVIGYYLGLRLSKQDQAKPNTDMIIAPDCHPIAFTFHDMTFQVILLLD